MTIVKCLKCRKKYDPGVDIGDMLDPNFSFKVICPACGQWMRLPEKEAIDAPGLPPDLLKEMSAQSQLVGDDEPESDFTTAKPTPSKPWWKFW